MLQHLECVLPFFVDDEVLILAKKGGQRLRDFGKIYDETLVEANVLEKAPEISSCG